MCHLCRKGGREGIFPGQYPRRGARCGQTFSCLPRASRDPRLASAHEAPPSAAPPSPRPPWAARAPQRALGRASATGPAGRGRGRSPVRSSCLTVRSCSPPSPLSPLVPAPPPPPPPSPSIFTLFPTARVAPRGPRWDSRRPVSSQPQEPSCGRATTPSSPRRVSFPLWPRSSSASSPQRAPLVRRNPAPCASTSSARPLRPQPARETARAPGAIGRRARASASAPSHWAAGHDVSRAAPPRRSNCCCLAGRPEREERGRCDWQDPRFGPTHWLWCARARRPSLS